MNRSRFKQRQPRQTALVTCHCHAKPALFGHWDSLTEAARTEFAINGPIPCEGLGRVGQWCEGCRFGVVEDPENV